MSSRYLLLAVCAVALARPSDAPAAEAGESAAGPMAAAPRIGLVLSGGGARGAAHVGVLKVLERERIPVCAIAGTSMGAVVVSHEKRISATGYNGPAATFPGEGDCINWC
jgi:NTE family protein